MSDLEKNDEINWNERYTRKVGIDAVLGLPQKDGYIRKAVIYDYPSSMGADAVRNFETHVKVGYNIVFSTESIEDDRLFSPNSNKRPNTVPSPLVGKTADGFSYIVMEIPKADEFKYKQARAVESHDKYLQSVGGTVSRKGNITTITENETKF